MIFLLLAQIALVVLQVTGVIAVSWWIIFLPVIMLFVLALVSVVVISAVAFLEDKFDI